MNSSDLSPEVAGTLVSGDVRRHNLSVVMNYVLQCGEVSRSQIATGTGLTRGSVTALTVALSAAGLLGEVPLGDTTASHSGKGRPRTSLRLTADHLAILTLQLDADQATGLLSTLAGEPLLRLAEHHGRPMGEPELVLDTMAAVLTRCLDACQELGREVLDTTIVVFAPIGGEPQVVLADTDLGWGAVDLLAGLRRREPRLLESAKLTSDVTLAAKAELGLLEDVSDIIYIKSNSGIGGAIISGGAVIEGAHGLAGALGHMPLVPGGELCGCGQYGCLVTVAGPDALLHAVGLGPLVASSGLTAGLAEVTERILADEPIAVAAWEDTTEWISRALQILSVAFDPQAIVLGGYWARLAESVAGRYKADRPTALVDSAWGNPAIVGGQLGEDAALMGAVWEAREQLLRDPLRISL